VAFHLRDHDDIHLFIHIRHVYQLNAFRPRSLRFVSVFCPFFVRSRARKPCRRFCTFREGLYVSICRRLPSTGAVVENVRATDGWSVKADVRSEGAIVGRVLVVAGVETASFEKAAPNEDVADRAVVGLEEMLLTVVKVLRFGTRCTREGMLSKMHLTTRPQMRHMSAIEMKDFVSRNVEMP